MTGPEIRGWEIAKAISRHRPVTVSADHRPSLGTGGVPVVSARRRTILREALRSSVVLAPWVPPFLLPSLLAFGTAIVSDLYDPLELEVEHAAEPDMQALAAARHLTALQLRYSSLVSCGGKRQRQFLASRQPPARPSPVVVPFGIPDSEPRSGNGMIRRQLDLENGDFVVLWWGSIWRWLDHSTAIRAVAAAAKEDPSIKLVITAGKPPHRTTHRYLATQEARVLARDLGVLGSSVFFYDEWIPYEERDRFIRDADLGLTLHSDQREAHLAVRARYLDYLWCGLPCVLAAGDEFGAEMEREGAATLVDPGEVGQTKRALLEWKQRLDGTPRGSQASLQKRHRWSHVTAPLVSELRSIQPQPRLAGLGALAASCRYYGARLDELVRSRI